MDKIKAVLVAEVSKKETKMYRERPLMIYGKDLKQTKEGFPFIQYTRGWDVKRVLFNGRLLEEDKQYTVTGAKITFGTADTVSISGTDEVAVILSKDE